MENIFFKGSVMRDVGIVSTNFSKNFSGSKYVQFISIATFAKANPVTLLEMRVLCAWGRMKIHRTCFHLTNNELMEGVIGVHQCLVTVKANFRRPEHS